ncbi:YHS domain protein [Pseudooceanicola marinus]|uniref:YHS domain protein n=1 Tax=Pseudooceanicola marinus TaxID=396013 RepID=A0A1X6YEE5_9RHOB|nr:YHS domain-containing (seleno)protein [Pseudooceanicola marinus]PJE32931.1 hypothetical protein CVM50_01350 [Pseudooceanicola marinus]SLN18196.1 YHS domain protein [Pseudooceanicola marinus]
MTLKSTITPLLSAAVTLAALAAAPAFAADEYNVINGLGTEGNPIGMHAMDPVALTTLGAVTAGDPGQAVTHDGVSYYFASSISAETFKADPEAFLPQYGGFCAFAIGLGLKLDGDPHYADIRDGKLYLFVSEGAMRKYLEDPEGILAKSDTLWGDIRHTAIADLQS